MTGALRRGALRAPRLGAQSGDGDASKAEDMLGSTRHARAEPRAVPSANATAAIQARRHGPGASGAVGCCTARARCFVGPKYFLAQSAGWLSVSKTAL